MLYREKRAWLSLIAMAVTFGPYFTIVAARSQQGQALPDLRQLGLFAAAALAQMLLLGVGHLYLHRVSSRDVRLQLDERDLAIMRSSMSHANYVLIAGMILVGCVMPFSATGWPIIHAALFMIVVAETVHYGGVVVNYRRQAW